jgi:PTS system galactitol-specific IIA component
MENLIFNEDLIELKFDAKSKEDVIYCLGDKLRKAGCIKEGFEEAVLEREKQYPTGLPTPVPIALCHEKAEWVKKTAISIATLGKPVRFNNMGNPNTVVDVDIVFLLAVKDPNNHMKLLKKLMVFFKDGETLMQIRDTQDKKLVIENLQMALE